VTSARRARLAAAASSARHRKPWQDLGRALVGAAAIAGGGAWWGGTALADTALVALVRPSASAPSATEALNRIQGELTAEGFDVVLVDAPIALASLASLGALGTAGPDGRPGSGAADDRDAVASIELVVDTRERAAELRVIDRVTNKTVTRRTAIEAPEGSQFAQVLAVRAVELLRASLVELLILSRPPPTPVPTAAVRVVAERARAWVASSPRPRPQSTFGFDAGTAVLGGFGGIGPALLGVLRVRRALGRSLQVRATLAGLGTQPTVAASSGSASVAQQLGLVEVLLSPWSDRMFYPVASVGAGAFFVSVDGQAVSPYAAERNSGWSAAVDAGLGAELRLSDHFDIALEAHAFLTRPEQVTRFVGQEQAGVGEPSVLGTLTVVGWL
jgi:hypothetical protein